MIRLRALAAAFAAFAALAQPAPPKPAEAAGALGEENKDLRSRIFILQYQSPHILAGVLQPLLSGARGCQVQSVNTDGLKALAVRDYPDNLTAIEVALKRLDQPRPVRQEVELTLQVLLASRQELPGAPMPEALKGVVGALQSTLNFRHFTLAASFYQRVADGTEFQKGSGLAEVAQDSGKPGSVEGRFKWEVGHLNLVKGADGGTTIAMERFEFTASTQDQGDLGGFRTGLSMKAGETVVVGTTTLRNRGLIVVLTAKPL